MAIRRRFVWLALLLGTEVALLLSLLIHPGGAALLGFLVFAVTHDWGRVLDRSPRLLNLVRAQSMARMFYVTPAFASARALVLDLTGKSHLDHAREDHFFHFPSPLDDAQLMRFGRAYAALSTGRDAAIVCLVLSVLALIALPGYRGGASAIVGVGVVFFVSIVSSIGGSVALRCLRVPTQRRVVAAQIVGAVSVPALGWVAAALLRKDHR